jgi:hypothetical protein
MDRPSQVPSAGRPSPAPENQLKQKKNTPFNPSAAISIRGPPHDRLAGIRSQIQKKYLRRDFNPLQLLPSGLAHPHMSSLNQKRALRSHRAATLLEKRCAAFHRQRPGLKIRPPVVLAPGAPSRLAGRLH